MYRFKSSKFINSYDDCHTGQVYSITGRINSAKGHLLSLQSVPEVLKSSNVSQLSHIFLVFGSSSEGRLIVSVYTCFRSAQDLVCILTVAICRASFRYALSATTNCTSITSFQITCDTSKFELSSVFLRLSCMCMLSRKITASI